MLNKNIFIFKLIPSFITIISLILGLSAIKAAVENNVSLAINLILLAAICDLLDGRVARILNATSEFGGELDSLSDFATFCIAPAFILYYCIFENSSSLGWVSCCFFIVAGLLRLARFNVLNDEDGAKSNKNYKNYFMGVPVPAGALLILFPFYLQLSYGIETHKSIIIVYVIIISLLMVSNIPTISTKNLHINKKFSVIILASLALFTLLLVYYTIKTLLICGIIYLISIPITTLLFFREKRSS
ncbi:CDP-diacylglycerol--serine O-phosphatidyltransferase [Rickettsiales bacterium LUAb2]